MAAAKAIALPDRISRYGFVLACATLPFAGIWRLPILLFIGTGVLTFASVAYRKLSWNKTIDTPLLLFLLFYLLQLVGFGIHPDDPHNRFALEQKASFLFLPIILSLLISQHKDAWTAGVRGFIIGNILASVYCLVSATGAYIHTRSTTVFFYHYLSGSVGANAIYMSLYLLIAMAYIIVYSARKQIVLPAVAVGAALAFLYCVLLLLSSKMLITAGSILLILLVCLRWKHAKARLLTLSFLALTGILIWITSNPVEKRFAILHTESIEKVMHTSDFTNYPFTGLDLRVLLWEMGSHVLQANNAWLLGMKGPWYHYALNERMRACHMFEGNVRTHDTGYIDYDMHNQYMENTMQYGITGLLLLLTLLAYVVCTTLRSRQYLPSVFVALFAFSFLTESVLETQAGILLFTLFIYGEWKQSIQTTSS